MTQKYDSLQKVKTSETNCGRGLYQIVVNYFSINICRFLYCVDLNGISICYKD
jgi:hypothetical protein